MNQSFKKKVIAASLASAFVMAGAGFVAVPGVQTMSVASANQFEASIQDAVTSKNLYAGGVAVSLNNLKMTEVGTWAAGKVHLILPSNVRLGTVSVTGTKAAPTDVTADVTIAAAGMTTAPDKAFAYIDTSNQTHIIITKTDAATNFTPDGTATNSSLTLTLKVKAPAGAATGDVNVQLVDGDFDGANPTGVTGQTIKMASVVDTVVSAKVASPASVLSGASAGAQTPGTATLTFNTDFADATLLAKTIDVTLNNGATFAAAPTLGGTITDATTSIVLTSSTTARITFANGGVAADASYGNTITLGGNAYLNLSAATAGPITATVSSTGSGAITGFSSQTVTLATATAAGTTVSYNDANGDAKLDKLYTGRTAGSVVPNDKVKLAEATAASLIAGGTIEVTLSGGAKFVTGQAPTATPSDGTQNLGGGAGALATSVLSAGNTKATFTVTAASAAASNVLIAFPQLDLTGASAGDLNVTIAGTAGASGTVKLADILAATTTTIASGAQSVAGGQVMTVPDVTVVENNVGAFGASRVIVLEIPGATLQKSTGDAADGDVGTNNSDVTVTLTDANGTAVSGTAISYQNGAGTAVDQLMLTLPATASSASTGVYTLKISGLKAKLASGTTPGDVNAIIGSGKGGAALTGAEDASVFDSSLGMTKATVKVGSVSSATVPTIPAATATTTAGLTTINASVGAAANDVAKVGSLFVVAILPNGQVFSKNSTGGWVLWDGIAQFAIASSVTLGNHSIEVVKDTSLTGLTGTRVFVGYGKGAFGPGGAITNPASNPTADMLTNFTYQLVYTVQ